MNDLPGDQIPPAPSGKELACGGVVFNDEGQVLLRRTRGDYGGVRWTFPKGRVDDGESFEAAALREVKEETAHKARILTVIPKWFEGDVTYTLYFVMAPVRRVVRGPHFWFETAEIRWYTPAEAAEAISQSPNPMPRKRDRDVLGAAVRAWSDLKATGCHARS